MNLQTLIDAIVRQTTVLIAQLATAQGVRAPLAHVANQVFLDLAEELASQGVSRKVSSDMFGLALRTYLRKIQRLTEGSTEQGQSLWDAVLQHLQQQGERVVLRGAVLQHFHLDEPEQVRSILRDMCESGLLFRLGSGDATGYRCASVDDLRAIEEGNSGQDELLWAIVYREGPFEFEALERRLPRYANLPRSLQRLVESGRVHCHEESGVRRYESNQFFVPQGAQQGWEAAVFDHFQAMVRTVAARLSAGAEQRETVGGSTYSFDVWPGHPQEQEALGFLAEFRARTSALRERIAEYNQAEGRPKEYLSITVYGGQSVVNESEDRELENGNE